MLAIMALLNYRKSISFWKKIEWIDYILKHKDSFGKSENLSKIFSQKF